MTLLPRGGDRGHRRETAELDGVPPRSRGARRGMAPDARRRGKTPRDLTRVCVLSDEKTRFRKLHPARPSPAKTEVEGVGSRRVGRVRDARKSSTREPRRVTRNHDSRVSSRVSPQLSSQTRVYETDASLTTMALTTFPSDSFFRDAFREADDVRPSRLSRLRSLDARTRARRRVRRRRERSRSDLPRPSRTRSGSPTSSPLPA